MVLKVLCQKCNAEYKIPEERLKGPARFACKSCGQEIYLIPSEQGLSVTGGRLKDAPPPPRPAGPLQLVEPEKVVQRLGKFSDLERIASGGMGEIFRAKMGGAEGFERVVALKVLHPHLARDESFAKGMVDEAKLTVLLQHPNIVQIFNLEREGDLLYLVMEFVQGRSLAQIQRTYRRRGGIVPVPMAIHIASEALEGLYYAHSLKGPTGEPLGLVHRDISPHNIMVTGDGWVKLIDFGIAKAASRLSYTRPGTIKGKFAYMAPEQLKGQADHRTDLFAMGVVLWETLAGVRLFHSSTDVDTLQKVLHLDPPPISMSRPEIPKNLDLILKRALAKDPEERFQTARKFKEALLAFVAPLTQAQLRERVDIEAACLGDVQPGDDEDLPEVGNTPAINTQDLYDAHTRAEVAQPALRKPGGPIRSSRWLVAGLIGLVLAGAGAGAWFGLRGPADPSDADAGTVAPTSDGSIGPDSGPVEAAGTGDPAAPPSADAGLAVADAGLDAGQPVAQAQVNPPVRHAPVVLDRRHVGKVLRRHEARLQKCADTHLAKLGIGSDVELVLDFTIERAGRVQGAAIKPAKFEASEFGRCLLGQVRQLRFPRHRDNSVSISFPLRFQVVGK